MARTLGKLFMSMSVGVLIFVAWFLWGTSLYTSQQQQRLAADFDSAPSFAAADDPKDGVGVGPPPEWKPEAGDPVFRLTIPAIELSEIVVEGVSEEELRSGPGHYPSCSSGFPSPLCSRLPPVWPGQEGRVIVSGHRTTYGAPFWDLDKLEEGDEIHTETKWGDFTYVVTHNVVLPAGSTALDTPWDGKQIALATCHPKYSSAERLIVFASLKEEGSETTRL